MKRSRNPFFILGNPRSGTTMLRLMLNAHPKVVVPPECGFAYWYVEKYANQDLTSQKVIEAFCEDVFVARKFETWGVSLERLKATLLGSRFDCYADMVEKVYIAYLNEHGLSASFIGDKNTTYIENIEIAEQYFPDSRYIFLVRDGRDVLCSYKKLQENPSTSKYRPKLDAQLESVARSWVDNCNRIQASSLARTITVRYEDILESPSYELERIFRFFSLEYDPGVLNFYSLNNEPAEFLEWKEKTTQPVDHKNKGHFKESLTVEELACFEHIAGESLDRFGYERFSKPEGASNDEF